MATTRADMNNAGRYFGKTWPRASTKKMNDAALPQK